MKFIPRILLCVLAVTVQAQTTAHISQVILNIQHLEQSGDLDAALKATDAALANFKEGSDHQLLQSTKARITRDRDTAIEMDAAMKALVADRTGTLEETRETLRKANRAGRHYLRQKLKSGTEREVEITGDLLVDLNDPFAADLMVERLKGAPDWSVFLVPYLLQISHQLNTRHLEVLIQAAERENLTHTQSVVLVLDTLENLADPGLLATAKPRKKLSPQADLENLAYHLTPGLQAKASQMLVRYIETQADGPLQERARGILLGMHLTPSISQLLDKLNVELPPEKAQVYLDLLQGMSGHLDPPLVEKLAAVALPKRPQQADLVHLLLDVLAGISSTTPTTVQKPRAKIPPEVVSLSSRLDDRIQQAILRTCLSALEHHDPASTELAKRVEEFLLLSRLPALPVLLVAEMNKDTKRPVTDRYVALAARMTGQFKGLDTNNQNILVQLVLRWAETRAKPGAEGPNKEALDSGTKLMVDSAFPVAPAAMTTKLLTVPPGPFADWLVAVLKKQVRHFEPGVVDALTKHVSAAGPQILPAANLLMQHLEQRAWEPDALPARLQPNATRLEKLVTRLHPGSHDAIGRALVAVSAAYAGKEDLAEAEKSTRARAEVMIVDSRLPPLAIYLADTFTADPKNAQAPQLLDLLVKISSRVGELDEGRKAKLVSGLLAFVRSQASAADTPAAKAKFGKASRLMASPGLVLRSEQLAAGLHEITEPPALAWAIKEIKSGPGFASQATLRSLADQAVKESPQRNAVYGTLLDGLNKLGGADTLASHLRAESVAPVIAALLAGMDPLNRALAASGDPKVQSPLKRDLSRAESILTTSGLPGIPLLLLTELSADPKRPEAETRFKLLARIPQRYRELDAAQRQVLFDAYCAFADARLTADLKGPAQAMVEQAGNLLSTPRLPGMAPRFAARLAKLKTGPQADWTARQLERMKGKLDNTSIKTLCTYLSTGGENSDLACLVLLNHLETLTGPDKREQLPALLATDVQHALSGALRAQLERQLALAEKPKGITAGELARIQATLCTGRLPGAIHGFYEGLVKDPARPAADTYVELIAREPARLVELSESQQGGLATALVSYLDTRSDAKQADQAKRAIRLLNAAQLTPTINVISSELHKDPARASTGYLVAILAKNSHRLRDTDATYQSRLASTLVKAIELRASAKANDPQAAVALQAVAVLGEGGLYQAAERMVSRLGDSTTPPTPELTRLLVDGLKKHSHQINRRTFFELSNIASRKGPNQAILSQLVVYILTREPSLALPDASPKEPGKP